MISVDLNCDMGESFGPWQMGNDSKLMDFVSSINVACGFHAGDPTTMRRTVETAVAKGVSIGAHPGFPDLQGFGRRNMTVSPQEVFDIVLYQVAALKGVCEASGAKLHHVKPHGALYNQAAKDGELAEAIAKAITSLDNRLIFYGLSGSLMISAANHAGLRSASEVFADRSYALDGSLTPRGEIGAIISNVEAAAAQALRMVREGRAITAGGETISIIAETICIHGDNKNALDFATAIRRVFDRNDIAIQSSQHSDTAGKL